jgi:ABC-type branched-subunit amino acid transport system substrate-binding protein
MSGIFIIALPTDDNLANELVDLLSGTFSRIKLLPPSASEAEKALNQADVALILTHKGWEEHINEHPAIARNIAYALSLTELPVLNVAIDGASFPKPNQLPEDFPQNIRAMTYLNSITVHSDEGKMSSVAHLAREVASILEQTSTDFESQVLSPSLRQAVKKKKKASFPVNLFMLLGIVACGMTTVFLARNIDRPLPGTSASQVQQQPENTISQDQVLFIGVSADLSGNTSEIGSQLLAGVAQALAERPSVMIDGVEISIDILAQDSTCSGAGGQRVAETFAASPDVIGVVGDQCNVSCSVASPIYQNAGLVAISPSCTMPELTDNDASTFNRVIAPTTAEAQAVADYLYAEFGDGVALIYDEQQHALQFTPLFETRYAELGGKLSITLGTETSIIDIDDLAENIEAVNATAVYYIGRAVNAGALRAKLGADVPFVASILGNIPAFVESAGEYADGTIFIQLEAPEVPEGFTVESAYAYDATQILLDALTQAITLEDDNQFTLQRAVLAENVRAYQGEGMTGTLNCATGDCASPTSSVWTIQEGSLVEHARANN